MKNFLILIALTVGLVSTSFIKNKTRLLDKELINLNKEINSLNYNLQDLNLEFEFITSPKNISLLANAKNTSPENITVCILERPRHKNFIEKDLFWYQSLKSEF